ncbi:hypothetical protein A4A49_61625, partial [Nicotiana attenuata]
CFHDFAETESSNSILKEGNRLYEFNDWFPANCYWKGDRNFKQTISFFSSGTFSSGTQMDMFKKGVFGKFFKEVRELSWRKLAHCMLLSQLFYKDNSKIIFKVFGHKVVFTDEDFHTITGLKVEAADYSFIDVRENRLTEWYFSEVNRGLKVENLFHFTEKRSRLSDGTTVKVSIDVEACDEVVVKLAQIYLLEAILL